MKNEIVEFYGQKLITAKSDEGTEYVAMQKVCENLGLDWRAQRKRMMRDEVISEGVVMMDTPTGNKGLGGIQKMIFLPIDLLNGWLFGVDVSRLKDEAVKAKIIVYKKECYKVLHNHWKPQSGSTEQRLDKLELAMGTISESMKVMSESIKLIAQKLPTQNTTNVMMASSFVTINPQLTDNKRRKEEFIRSVIDVLANFEEGISQTALFFRIEFSQSSHTRRWLHEGIGTFWDMYMIPGNGYRYISKEDMAEINS